MLRLQRVGKRKQPTYRLVVSDKLRDTQGKALEILGQYNPLATPKVVAFNIERVQYWLARGAQPSATVHNILVAQGARRGDKMKSVYISKKRRGKIDAAKATAAPAAGPAPEDPAETSRSETPPTTNA